MSSTAPGAAATTTATTATPSGSGQDGASSSAFEALDLNYLELLGQEVPLNEIWKEKYEEWIEVEVFSQTRDWDEMIKSPLYFDLKPMEF